MVPGDSDGRVKEDVQTPVQETGEVKTVLGEYLFRSWQFCVWPSVHLVAVFWDIGGGRVGKSKAVKPTLAQKKYISAAGLNARDWLVLDEAAKEMKLVHKGTGKSRIIMK